MPWPPIRRIRGGDMLDGCVVGGEENGVEVGGRICLPLLGGDGGPRTLSLQWYLLFDYLKMIIKGRVK